MTKTKPETTTDKAAPLDLTDAEMDQATGGWGRTSYYSYAASREASYTVTSSDKGGGASS